MNDSVETEAKMAEIGIYSRLPIVPGGEFPCVFQIVGYPLFHNMWPDFLTINSMHGWSSHTISMSRLDLSQFEVIEKLGAGAYGTVMKGRRKDTGEIVALKFMDPIEGGTGLSKATTDEIEALMRLKKCPNICCLEGYFNTPKGVCLVSKYCEYDLQGFSLLTDISVVQFKSIVRQLCVALSAVHGCGYMHRDVKPENILITARNEVKLTDFGLARSYKDVSRQPLSADVGTRSYQAPELLLGSREYGPEIDIWSLGCVLYYLITKELLFPVNNRNDVLNSLVTKRGSPAADWPEYKSLPNKGAIEKLSMGVQVDFEQYLVRVLPKKFRGASALIAKMLRWQPKSRITAAEALSDPYLNEVDSELEPANLPVATVHELHDETKKEKIRLAKPRLPPTLGALHLRGLPPPVCA